MTIEEIREKFKVYYNYLKRPGAKEFMEWLENNGFFEAPASTKYHGNYAGGLAEHSIHVAERLFWITDNETKNSPSQYPEYTIDTLVLVGLLHDVCKIDQYKIEKKESQKETYTYTNAFPVGHGEKSIILIMRYMQLSDEEIMAIRWHMGAFDEAARGGSRDMNNAFKESKLAVMLHMADMMATHLDERETEKKENG